MKLPKNTTKINHIYLCLKPEWLKSQNKNSVTKHLLKLQQILSLKKSYSIKVQLRNRTLQYLIKIDKLQ